MGEIVGGVANPLALVGFVVLLMVLLRYISIRLISSGQYNIKEVSMKKTLTARLSIFFSCIFETIWNFGIGGVVGQLST
jgi:hypothetical protein